MRLISNRSGMGRASTLWRSRLPPSRPSCPDGTMAPLAWRSLYPTGSRDDASCVVWRDTPYLWLTAFLSLFFALELIPVARAETVTIAAAADLTYCIEDLNRSYQQSHPDTELKLSTG